MSLTIDERALADRVGFDPAACESVKSVGRATLVPFGPADGPAVGLAYPVTDGDVAERQLHALQLQLLPLGYRAFWTKLHEENGRTIGDAVAVLHATDPYAILDAAQPDGGNYDVSTDDIRARLRSWEDRCRFEIVGADRDWVAVVFDSLPPDLCAFAEEVYWFCSDIFEADMGSAARAAAVGRASAAAARCPDLSPQFWAAFDARHAQTFGAHTAVADLFGDDGDFLAGLRSETLRNVQRFADKLAETKYLFLWWD